MEHGGCHRPEPFPNDRHRVEYFFALYEKLTAPLVTAAKSARKRRKVQAVTSQVHRPLAYRLIASPSTVSSNIVVRSKFSQCFSDTPRTA